MVNCQGRGALKVTVRPIGLEFPLACAEGRVKSAYHQIAVSETYKHETARARLAGREIGSELEDELRSSARKARLLDEQVPADTVRVATDGWSVGEIAREVVGVVKWGAGGGS
ncbi:hypothetical protein ACFW9D_06600 [Streptomyces sp. NPDC059524]|uniref:hypothetical protein n=1 Tax=Streptomyces sp. NPDC059524 TaxID=3346856 RepID=UPI0036B89F8C